MAKPQRKSINDTLAEVAAEGPPVVRGNVERDNGARDQVIRENVPVGGARDHVPRATRHLSAGTDEDGYRTRVRREKPHASLYAHPRVFAAIRDLAEQERCRPHDLYVEGLRLMLARYGLDFDQLDGRA